MAAARAISLLLFLCCSFWSVLLVQCDTKTLTITSGMNCILGDQTLEDDDVIFIQYNGARVRKCDLHIKAEYELGHRVDDVICFEAKSFHVDCSVKVQYCEGIETIAIDKTYSCNEFPPLWCSSKNTAFIRIVAPKSSSSNFRIKASVKDASDICNGQNQSHKLSCPSGCCRSSDNLNCCNRSMDIRTIGGITAGCLFVLGLLIVTTIVFCCNWCRKAKASGDRTLQANSIPRFTTAMTTASPTTSDVQITTTALTLGLNPPPYRPTDPIIEEYPLYEYCNPSSNFPLEIKQYDDPPPSYEQVIKSC
ncbi:hypothetical protein CHS0354_006320 [Potamilus streckersoni]|uniref:CUB domain-containing protein n=1 Tax=Potamilus streckersoni TaxID=2493646 RepID=A0AAE0S4U9_9BIVA|nr:hypothetical protein CHS0354_006320 [Potamilus streckersoni]